MGYVCEFKLNNKTIAKTKEITYNVGTILRKCTGLKWNLNTNNGLVKDIIDKTTEPDENSKHHKLTNELIKTKYIKKDDVEADCFDEIFKNI